MVGYNNPSLKANEVGAWMGNNIQQKPIDVIMYP